VSDNEHLVRGATKELAELHAKRANTSLGFDLLVESGDYSSELILRDGIFEIPETDLVTRLVRLGDTCIDGGCHLGYYTCLMAKLAGPQGHVYAFDANPWCCQRTERNLAFNGLESAEVIHAALGNERGTTSFHISTDDQTGLSSLGSIERQKEVIPVPWLRLEDILERQGVQKVRLLKLDVEGAEKIALLGLGKFLTEHRVDFVLLECYDERLQLLKCSTEDVAKILGDASYLPWEYDTENPSGWSRANRVQSRGDCNYLFVSPLVREPIPRVSLAGALSAANGPRREEIGTLRRRLESDVDWLNDAVKEREQEVACLRKEKDQLETVLSAVEHSKGWRLLNACRKVRDLLLGRSRRSN
jgi:FkbM family methyltransferase